MNGAVRLLTAWVWMLAALPALAAPGVEVVVVVDIEDAEAQRQTDLAIGALGALVRGSQDAITVVPAGRQWRSALQRARAHLEASGRDDRMLIMLADQVPSGVADPRAAPRVLGLRRANLSFRTVVVPVQPNDRMHNFLKPLALHSADYLPVEDPSKLLGQLTRAFARASGSRAVTGEVSIGEHRTVRIGRHVSEVLVVMGAVPPASAFSAKLFGHSGNLLGVHAMEDDPPHLHYRVWRVSHDPRAESNFQLFVNHATGPVAYAVVPRYDLEVHASAPDKARLGKTVTLKANLEIEGRVYDDPGFIEQEGLEVVAWVEGKEVPLDRGPRGHFTGLWLPDQPSAGTPTPVTVVFRSPWLDKRAELAVRVAGSVPLMLSPAPTSMDLGSWPGARTPTRRCRDIDLSASTNADRVPVELSVVGLPPGVRATLTPDDPDVGAAREGRQPLRWSLCIEAEGCCGAVQSTGETAVQIRGRKGRYRKQEASIPLQFSVAPTSPWSCWWPWVVPLGLTGLMAVVITGYTRPHGFDRHLQVRVAATEEGLEQADGLALVDLPGGTRGFFRHAQVHLAADGDFVASRRGAVLSVQARASGGTRLRLNGAVQKKDPRTLQWGPVQSDDGAAGLRTNLVYRVGDVYLRFH